MVQYTWTNTRGYRGGKILDDKYINNRLKKYYERKQRNNRKIIFENISFVSGSVMAGFSLIRHFTNPVTNGRYTRNIAALMPAINESQALVKKVAKEEITDPKDLSVMNVVVEHVYAIYGNSPFANNTHGYINSFIINFRDYRILNIIGMDMYLETVKNKIQDDYITPKFQLGSINFIVGFIGAYLIIKSYFNRKYLKNSDKFLDERFINELDENK